MSRSMKDSGVAYLGEIDSDFDVKPINSLFAIKKDIIGHEPDMVLSITQTGIKPKDIESNEGQIAASYANYQIVNIGDFAMNHMDLITGGVDISKYEGVTSPDYRVFVLKEKEMIDKFFLYVFQLYYKTRTFFGFGQGVANLGRWRLPASNFKNILIPITSAENQMKIVEVLDKKCSEIDTLIVNQQKQIEKLKQYKQSVISEAMTKGLNPNVEMKNSGVEWIGKIPSHWSLSKVSNFYEIVLGKMLQPQPNDGDTLEQYLCAANVGGNKLNLNFIKEMWFSEKEKAIYKLKRGDLVVVEGGDVASSAIIDFEPDNLYFQNALHRARAIRGETAFLRYWLIFAKGSGYFDIVCNKATIAHFTKDKFKALPMIYVSISEQKEIIKHLDEKCSKIDSLIAIKQQKIEKLNQYKKSIIYEYVTGKKEA